MRLVAHNDLRIRCEQDCPVVAMLRPHAGGQQWVVAERYDLTPWVPAREYIDTYGNLCQRFVVPQGEFSLRVTSEVEVADLLAVDAHAPATPVEMLPDDALVYLLQSRYCPSECMEDEAREVVRGCAPGYAQADRICRWVHERLDYRYGVSDMSTDARQTLEHGAGVCRDFAHVGVTLCRALRIPARYVVGYLHGLDPMDMHAWYEAYVGGRWFTFDPTQAEPRAGRIVVGYGRDVADVAFLSHYGPLEVDQMQVRVDRIGP
jgi:transglutaminase-like putative cysteine protease